MERVAKLESSEHQLELFEVAFNAVWRRALTTLGEVTMMAVVGRVLFHAAESHPALGSIQIVGAGIDCRGLRPEIVRPPSQRMDTQPLAEGLRFLLVDLLTVLGNLTAGILTPALHAALTGVTVTPVTQGKLDLPGAGGKLDEAGK